MRNSEWIPVWEVLPSNLQGVDITLETPDRIRFCNIAIYRTPNHWEILLDRHHFQDCKIVAWRMRPDPFTGNEPQKNESGE